MIAYRPDIDGLRAVAITLVVLYHGKFGLFPGGFVGVDIFFVISGYLIALIIFSEISAGTFSIGRFYDRRVRRIIPALVVVVAAVLAAGAVLDDMPWEFAKLAASAKAALAFYSNFYFAGRTGYFVPVSEVQPLLHTWSLSVEEQFYVVAPLTLAAVAGWPRPWKRLAFVAAMIASLYFSMRGVSRGEIAAFFWPHTRAFELLTGVGLAAAASQLRISPLAKELAAAAGVTFVLAAAIVFSRATPFPGFAALVPCLGAALIIHGGGETRVARMLAAQPVVGLGKISYSLYLWHWPVFVFAGQLFGSAMNIGQRAALVAVSLALATLSFNFVEQPFRGASLNWSRRRILVSAFAAMALCGAGAQAIVTSGGWPDRLPAEAAAFAKANTTEIDIDNLCAKKPWSFGFRVGICEIGSRDDVAPSFVVWGDSHARAVAMRLSAAADSRGLKGYFFSRASCAPLFGYEGDGSRKTDDPQKCQQSGERLRQLLDKQPSLQLVVIVARWGLYAGPPLSEPGIKAPEPASAASNRTGPQFGRLLRGTVETLAGHGRSIVVFGPLPELAFDLPPAILKAKLKHEPAVFPVDWKVFRDRQQDILPALADIDSIPNVHVFYPHKVFCTGQTCATSDSGHAYFVDGNHLSPAGVDRISGLIERAFDDQTAASASAGAGR